MSGHSPGSLPFPILLILSSDHYAGTTHIQDEPFPLCWNVLEGPNVHAWRHVSETILNLGRVIVQINLETDQPSPEANLLSG